MTLSALAQICFKLGLTARQADPGATLAQSVLGALLNPGVLGGLALYGFGTLVWLLVLSKVEVSKAYPFVGLSFVVTAVLGHLIFKDDLNALRIGGIALVIAGIALVARS